ncbi:MAG TPA: hypothetical protein VH302_03370 [Bryobacteraceae bacterium]|nr:hypothetical protein [Bryobacteraceae bacterium]
MRSFTKTVTDKQLAANQANGQKSHGPASSEGKAISSQNATRHGLCGRFKVLPGESQEKFDSLFEQFMKDERAVGSVETELVRRMAEYTWLRDRAARFQNACFYVAERTAEDIADGKADIHFSPELERFLRYQAHFDRSFARASAELLKRRKERELQESRFVSQKHAAAGQQRREMHEQRQQERHFFYTANAKLNLERKEMAAAAASAAPSRRLAA